MEEIDKIAKITIFSFGSAIVECPIEVLNLSLLWEFTNSWNTSDGYLYSKPKKIIEKDGKFYHLFL